MKQLNMKTPLVFRLGVVLLCVMLMSTHLTGNLYARYSTTATGSDSARVARFSITNTLTTPTQNTAVSLNFYDPEKLKDTITFEVSSSSEVAVEYDVVVTLPSGPDYSPDYSWLSITLGDNTTITGTGDANVFTFSDAGEFAPNSTDKQMHTMTFSILESYQGKPNGLTNITGEVQITVHAEQID